jgi:hypothetical protein
MIGETSRPAWLPASAYSNNKGKSIFLVTKDM